MSELTVGIAPPTYEQASALGAAIEKHNSCEAADLLKDLSFYDAKILLNKAVQLNQKKLSNGLDLPEIVLEPRSYGNGGSFGVITVSREQGFLEEFRLDPEKGVYFSFGKPCK